MDDVEGESLYPLTPLPTPVPDEDEEPKQTSEEDDLFKVSAEDMGATEEDIAERCRVDDEDIYGEGGEDMSDITGLDESHLFTAYKVPVQIQVA